MACQGLSTGIPFVRYDVTPLPANAPSPPGELTNHGNSRQAVVLHMRYKSGPITASSFLLQLLKGKHLHVTEQLLVECFVCLCSCVPGK